MSLLRSECTALSGPASSKTLAYLTNFTARKVQAIPGGLPADVPDSLAAWATRYLALAVVGVRSPAVMQKFALHLDRFLAFFIASYGHQASAPACATTCWPGSGRSRSRGWRRRRSTTTWPRSPPSRPGSPPKLPMSSRSAIPPRGFASWGWPPLEPRALTPAQVRSLKNLCDRLERFHRLKG